MENALWVSYVVLGFILAVALLWFRWSDSFLPPKRSSVRVRVDEDPRRPAPEPRDEAFERQPKIGLLVLCAILVFVLMLAGNG